MVAYGWRVAINSQCRRAGNRASRIEGSSQLIKKIVALMLALCMTLCAAAAMAEEKTMKYLDICQAAAASPRLHEATRGFRDALTEKLGDR